MYKRLSAILVVALIINLFSVVLVSPAMDNIAYGEPVSAPSNIALNKTALASSSCNGSEGAAKAFDGNTQTKWCASPGAGAWLQVDLQGTHILSGFKVFHAEKGWEPASRNTKAYRIQTSLNGVEWTERVSVAENASSTSEHAIAPISAKYVKLLVDVPAQIASETAARINDFEVYGIPDPNRDLEAPTAPAALTVAGRSDTSVTLGWAPSTDNTGVTAYRIYGNGGNMVGSVTGSTYAYTVTGLTASTAYQFVVKAADSESNLSEASPAVEVTTMPALTNIALNKPATTSGQCNANEIGSKALDGNSYTKWCQGNGSGGWLQVELGQHYKVSKFVVKHGGVAESSSYNTKDFAISVSSDGSTWNEAVRVTGNTQSTTTHIIPETAAKYVKLTIQTPEQGSYATIRIPEFEVYGYLDPDADNEPPTSPDSLTATDVRSTKASLSWSASSDNVAVTAYDIYVDALKVGTTAALSYTVTGLAPMKTYAIMVRAKDASGNSSPAAETSVTTIAGQFAVSGTKILDPDGEAFIIKGVNVDGYNWVWNRDITPDSEISLIKDVWKFNTIRVNNKIAPGSFFKDINHLYKIIDKYTAAGMVVQVEAHDFSGSYYTDTTTPSLTDLVQFHKNLALKYKDNPYVWFNIMNEPGSISPQFVTTHERVIKAIREEAGASNIIVVDGAQFASETKRNFGEMLEEESAVLTYGEQLAAYGNITFALHMYDSWESGGAVLPNGKKRLQDYIDKVHAKGLSFHIGEYGSPYNSDVTTVIDTVRDVAGDNNIGRIVWSWFAGDAYHLADARACHGGYCIDKKDGTKPGNLTRQGNSVWNDNHNIEDVTDLSIVSVQLDKTEFQAGDKIKLLALLKNSGDKKITGDVTIGFYINGTKVATEEISPSLMFKESIPVVSAEIEAPSDNITVMAVIEEADSSYGTDAEPANNSLSTSIQGWSAVDNADPRVAQIRLVPDKATYHFGDAVTLEAAISNEGTKEAGGGKASGTFYVNGAAVETVESASSIPAGGSLVLTGIKPITLTEDAAVSFMMNNTYTTPDGNASNNSLYRIVMLHASDHVNLALNPGFEQGDVEWSNWGGRSVVSENPHSGDKALKIGIGVGGGGQNVELEPNTTYVLTAWAKHDAKPNGKLEIGVQYRKAPGDPQTKHIMYIDNVGEYALHQIMFTTPPALVEGNVFAWKPSTDAYAFVDDLYLSKVGNVLSDGGFESGNLDDGWVNYGLGFDNKTVVAEPVQTGNHAVRIGTMAGGIKKSVDLDANTTYVLGAWTRHDQKPLQDSEIGVEFQAAEQLPMTQHKMKVSNSGDYEYRQVMFTTPGRIVNAGVFLNKTSDDGRFLYVDDIVLTRIPNLLLNPGFESGEANWSSYGNRSMVEERPLTGTKALKVGDNVGGGQQNIQLEPNTTYMLGVSGQVTSENGEVHTGVQYRPEAGAEQIKHILAFDNKDNYAYQSVVFTTPAQVVDANVFVWKPASGYYAYLDDFILTKMPSIAHTQGGLNPPSGPQVVQGTVFGAGEAWRDGSQYDMAFDGDIETYFDAKTPDGNYAGIDAGEGNEQQITKIRFYTPDTSWGVSRMVGGRFQGSNTSSDGRYYDLHTITTTPAPGWTEVEITDPNAYRYLRYLAPAGSHGNVAEIEFIGEKGGVLRDEEAPVITFAGHKETYTLDEQVHIACHAEDALSGIARTTCKDITSPAYKLKWGLNTYTFEATDHAGNKVEATVTFTVEVTAAGLEKLIKQFIAQEGHPLTKEQKEWIKRIKDALKKKH